MKNKDKWQESKFTKKRGKWYAGKWTGKSSWLISTKIVQLYAKYIPIYWKDILLDLWCWNVPLYGLYKENNILNPTCIDWENSLHKNIFLDEKKDLNLNLNIKKKYNTIILSDVLEHIYETKKLIREIYNILEKDGYLIINTPFFYRLHETPHDYYRYTDFFYQRLCDENNLKIIKKEYIWWFISIVIDMLWKTIGYIPFIWKSIAYIINYIGYLFLKLKPIKYLDTVSAKTWPQWFFFVIQKT